MDDKSAELQAELIRMQIDTERVKTKVFLAELDERAEHTTTLKAQRKAIEEHEATRKLEFEMRAKELENAKSWGAEARVNSILNAAALLMAGGKPSHEAVANALALELAIRNRIESGS